MFKIKLNVYLCNNKFSEYCAKYDKLCSKDKDEGQIERLTKKLSRTANTINFKDLLKNK